ncbi:hypothetical protein COO20_20625 [Thalassospira marina]|uniref:Uncharacterized protein n=1 Tax=Thalassospira marina TaxID=2048283 RepID=A0A2N3KJ13_9PROT|nr:hypothetical protein COO20_20625 [Thalassospira marina]
MVQFHFPVWVGHLVCWFTLAPGLIWAIGLILPESSRFAVDLSRIWQKSAISIGANEPARGAKSRDFSRMMAPE